MEAQSNKELEKVQNRAARFVTRNYVYQTGSMTGILGQLKWEPLIDFEVLIDPGAPCRGFL